MTERKWLKVTAERPCPKCGKPDKCIVAPDGGAGHCFRPEGGGTWRETTQETSAHRRAGGAAAGRHRGKPQDVQPMNDPRRWKAEYERLREAMTEERLAALATATGVPASAWATLSPGWATADDLRAMRAGGAGWTDNFPDGAYVFAERDGDGNIVGLSFRAFDGRKGSPAGAKRGLVVPADLHDLVDPVLGVEGASDVAACAALRLPAVGRPSNTAGAEDLAEMLDGRQVLVVGERDAKPDGRWPGRDGAKKVAQRIAGRWDEHVAWTLPPQGTKDIREWLGARVRDGLNLSDPEACRAAGAELLAELQRAAKEVKPQRRTQADAVIELAREQYRFGVSEDGDPFAVPLDGPNIALVIRGGGGGFRAALAKKYRDMTGRAPSTTAMSTALLTLEGIAQDAPREPVALRLTAHNGGTALDLGDANGQAVTITTSGWAVQSVSPVLFRRTALSGSLPEPVTTAAGLAADALFLNELRSVLNVDEDSWPLVVGYMVAALVPDIPHPVLMFGGDQGTGKSTGARMVVDLLDPSPAPLRSEPRDPRQWVISAAGSYVVALDNVSRIPDWLSDAICKAVTGDGWVDRKLYTDADLAVLSLRRCVIITSIDVGALRGDLGDRTVLVDLTRIPDEVRRTEGEIVAAFRKMRPRLLSALLSALALTLGRLPDVNLDGMPRMADFARVLAALDAACPSLTSGRALDLFVRQRQRISMDVVEGDVVASAVTKYMEQRGSWSGTASELLSALTAGDRRPKGWPENARALVGRLGRVRDPLAKLGIVHEPPTKTDKTRTHRLTNTVPRPPEPPEPPETSKNAPAYGLLDVGAVGGRPAVPPTDGSLQLRPLAGESDCSGDVGGSGGVVPTVSTQSVEPASDTEFRFQERAAICEFDGGLSRPEAERLAGEHLRGDAERNVA